VTIRLPWVDFLSVVHSDHASSWHKVKGKGKEDGNGKGEGKGEREEEGKGKGKRKRKGKGKEKGKGKGRWKEDSLRKRKVGRTHGHLGDFILWTMLCIALDRQ